MDGPVYTLIPVSLVPMQRIEKHTLNSVLKISKNRYPFHYIPHKKDLSVCHFNSIITVFCNHSAYRAGDIAELMCHALSPVSSHSAMELWNFCCLWLWLQLTGAWLCIINFSGREALWCNCIEYGSDNSLVGRKNSVLSNIRKVQPQMFDLGCVCHLANIVCQAGVKKIPLPVEDLLIQTYFHLHHR